MIRFVGAGLRACPKCEMICGCKWIAAGRTDNHKGDREGRPYACKHRCCEENTYNHPQTHGVRI
ncbi:MAG: hypothetical protein LBC75_14060 [Fibromonadaceae bacterium]|nr:hypothetical protein [Fibromonadaceae bacterium]